MVSSFDGRTARNYRRYRRDVAQDVIDELVGRANWSPHDLVIDLGCGTGQATVPLCKRVGSVLACDVEPDQLHHLRNRLHTQATLNVLTCLAGDGDLAAMSAAVGDGAAGLIVANALHWMDEDTLFAALPSVLRQGATFAVITHGPPLWLGMAPWQRAVRHLLEDALGPVSATCGTDDATLHRREKRLAAAGYRTGVLRHEASYEIDADWVVGHLLSAISGNQLDDEAVRNLRRRVEKVVPAGSIEQITTTILTALIT